jgi:hypothetical protein
MLKSALPAPVDSAPQVTLHRGLSNTAVAAARTTLLLTRIESEQHGQQHACNQRLAIASS